MSRPSALSDRQWAEIGRRLAGPNPESMRKLAKEFGVGVATISERFSERVPKLKALANTLASAEREVERLPVSEQVAVRSLADQLKAIGNGLANVAGSGIRTAEKLSALAEAKATKLTATSTRDQVGDVVALQEGANRAVATGMAIMAANKPKDAPSEDLTLGSLLNLANRKD